mgnify:CR=1 FL=1
MVAKNIMKNPILIIGILMVIALFFDLKNKGLIFQRYDKMQAKSCKSALVILKKKVPDNWSLQCKINNLRVEIEHEPPKDVISNEMSLKKYMYRKLANNLVLLAKSALIIGTDKDGKRHELVFESFERISFINLRLKSSKLDLEAFGEGKHVAKLATLSTQEFIRDHLKNTINVKELAK